MSDKDGKLSKNMKILKDKMLDTISGVPLLGWLFGILIAVLLEHFAGDLLVDVLGLPKIPVLFGCVIILKKPLMIPGAMLYMLLIYILPISIVARLSSVPANRVAAKLLDYPMFVSVLIHIALFYASLYIWSEISAYRVLTLKLTLVAIILTLSLNVINGYMGEFSCSHPGFMALGAYGASVFTVLLFANDKIFGHALLPPSLGPFMFPIALIIGGITAALGALVIAIPSFRTRGDYLAIISLALEGQEG